MKIILFIKSNILKSLLCFTLLIVSFIILLKNVFSNYFIMQPVYSKAISNNLLDTISELAKEDEKIAYLTFDDGPTTSITPKILTILKEENVKATFFVIGKLVEAHPEIVKMAYEEGHYIANHSYSHNNSILYKSKDNFINEIKKTDIAIGNAIDDDEYCSHVFRFPNGFMSTLYKTQKENYLPLLKEMDYFYIDWNCLNNDSMGKYSNYQLLENMKQTSKGKNTLVIVMHDTKDVSDSSFVLKDSIEYLKAQGYIFKNFYEFIDN